jgi:hypothetical protein
MKPSLMILFAAMYFSGCQSHPQKVGNPASGPIQLMDRMEKVGAQEQAHVTGSVEITGFKDKLTQVQLTSDYDTAVRKSQTVYKAEFNCSENSYLLLEGATTYKVPGPDGATIPVPLKFTQQWTMVNSKTEELYAKAFSAVCQAK